MDKSSKSFTVNALKFRFSELENNGGGNEYHYFKPIVTSKW